MKVAIVHDFLLQMGGAEKVVETLHLMFPEAPIYTSAFDSDAMPPYYRTWDIRTSFLQRLPLKSRLHRACLPLYPLAFESFDLSEYDLVISSCSAFAKGVNTLPKTRHICYTHTPMRYVWMPHSYLKSERTLHLSRLPLMPILSYLRLWDAEVSRRVDTYIANSSVVEQRIAKFYGRKSHVVFPPVDTERFAISSTVDDYYILVSRFVPYKRLDLAVQACTRLNRRLKVVGAGRHVKTLQEAAGPTVEFVGRLDDVELPGILARARAYLMPGEEDFGIAPVEANACGRPVIAYAAGGALDSQVDGVTGVLFSEQSVDGLCAAILRAESISFDPAVIRDHARRFDTGAFCEALQEIIAHEASGTKTHQHDRTRAALPGGVATW
jgi:glycosyltransferase involved in cell wall biosynthesis